MASFVLGLLCLLGQAAHAQQFGPTIRIPIEKVLEYYCGTNESGTRKQGGVRLFGEWPVYRDYTNSVSYTKYTTGVVCGAAQSIAPVGGRFRFYCTFSGFDTPNLDAPCPTEGGGQGLPDWFADVRRRGPIASFTNRALPPVPGEFEFTSTSTDPDLEPIALELWTFGDGADGLGISPIHRYTKPGSFTVGLTVRDTDGLTNRTTRTIVVPAPRLTNSLRVISQHSGNRIAPNEVFEVRATVSATADGIGDLSNVAFAGAPLEIPTNGFTVVEAPPDTNIGILKPGDQRTYTWKLKAGGFGDFVLRTARLTGVNAAGAAVSATPAVALGSVSALIIGLEQYPPRIGLGEDNNGDGIVNSDDALVKVVISITNVAEVDVASVQADNVNAPLAFVSRLVGVLTALDPVTVPPGNYGTIKPGAGNALVRTNIYRATNYVLATAALLISGTADGVSVRAGGDTIVRVDQPHVKITMHALGQSGLTPPSIAEGKQSINAPLVPVSSGAILNGQPKVSSGLIGDGVTPLLFILEGDSQNWKFADELKLTLVATVASGGRLTGDNLQARLQILKEGAWVASDKITLTPAEPKGYVQLTPVKSDEVVLDGGRELRALLSVRVEESGPTIEELEFKIAKPLVTLIHGFNEGILGWGPDFLEPIQLSRMSILFDYDDEVLGTGAALGSAFTASQAHSLEYLAGSLPAKIEPEIASYRDKWAFTRYDVVGHGQGGVLARMLSSKNSDEPFRNEANHYRGRFHRIVTIGAPHNGSRFLYFVKEMLAAQKRLGPENVIFPGLPGTARFLTSIMILQNYDPFGFQIEQLTDTRPSAEWYPDPGAQFHLVRTKVYGDEEFSNTNFFAPPIAHLGFHLWDQLSYLFVLPRGSDGVVDFDSMGSASSANVFSFDNSFAISHYLGGSYTETGPDVLGGLDGSQVKSGSVGFHVIAALDQDSKVPASDRRFGPFPIPPRLSGHDKQDILQVVNNRAGINNPPAGLEVEGLPSRAKFESRRIDLKLTLPAGLPVNARGVYWFAEVFGTNGVSTDGLILTPDPVDKTRATLAVDPAVVGDVVASAFYISEKNGPVYTKPQRVASFEPVSPLKGFQVLPQGTSVPVGMDARVEVYARYEDGSLLRRFVLSNEVAAASAAPLIVDVSNPLVWKCLSAGRAFVSVTWRGLATTGEVSVIAQRQNGLPVSGPLVWLRSDAGITLTNGTNVVSWTDQSLNQFVFSAPIVAMRPEWVANSTSGVPAIRFNSSSTPWLQGNLGRTLSNATIFTLARYLNNATGARYIYAFGTINYSGLMMTLAREGGDDIVHYDGAASRPAPNSVPGTGFRVLSQVYGEGGPDRHRLAVDGRTVIESHTTVGRPYSAAATNVVLGKYVSATFGFTGDLVEWIVYDRVLSVEERFEVEEYLRQRARLVPFVPAGSLDLAASENVDFAPTPSPSTPWSLNSANRTTIARYSDAPSVSLAELSVSNQVIRTRITPTASTGSVGVVFGYLNPSTFHLFDWRQTNGVHALWGTARAGMRWRSFHIPGGESPDGADFWSGSDPARVTMLHSNNVSWVPGRTYDFILSLRTNETAIDVNFGTTNLARWTVPGALSGRFGHYAQSVTNATFGPVLLPGARPVITGFDPVGDGQWTLRWANGVPPFVIEASSTLSGDDWDEVAPATPNNSRIVQPVGGKLFYRVRSAGVVQE